MPFLYQNKFINYWSQQPPQGSVPLTGGLYTILGFLCTPGLFTLKTKISLGSTGAAVIIVLPYNVIKFSYNVGLQQERFATH